MTINKPMNSRPMPDYKLTVYKLAAGSSIDHKSNLRRRTPSLTCRLLFSLLVGLRYISVQQ